MTQVPEFRSGDRVVIRHPEYREFWANGAIGTVTGDARTVSSSRGATQCYWVTLDAPREDNEGDGPYDAAVFPASYLRPVQPT